MRRALPAGIIAIATARALPDAANHRAEVACYIRRYGDLARNFCRGPGDCDLAGAERHWTARGRRENRTFGCANASRARCRWLWFAGMHGRPRRGVSRAVRGALLTARENAPVLQPVLMLGRGGLAAGDGLSKFGRWAQGRGALVFTVRRLAFQEHLDRLGFADRFGDDHAQGPYLRLHAPVLIREHDLMTAGICSDVFLYTDCDTLFLNVDAHAMTHEAARLASHVWSFGPQKSRAETSPQNTGVWLVNHRALARVYPDLLRFAVARKFRFRETFDQGWIKEFSHSRRGPPSSWARRGTTRSTGAATRGTSRSCISTARSRDGAPGSPASPPKTRRACGTCPGSTTNTTNTCRRGSARTAGIWPT